MARYDNLPGCPDMLAASVYDTKPVHLLSTVAELIEWKVKEKQVWNQQENKKKKLRFLRLNLIDKYNHHMNSTDIADQLRGIYCPNHWMQFRE